MADEGKLNRWRLLAELTSQDAEVVLKACEERILVGGEELFHENDSGDSLFIVQSGRVDIFKNIRGDVDRSLASFGPGDVIGEMSFIDGARRSATARTTESSEFLVLSRQSRSEEHTSELQSPDHLVCRLLLEKKNNTHSTNDPPSHEHQA